MTRETLLAERRTTPDEALAVFDALPAATPADMIGRWRGYEIASGHPLDGLLARAGWAGKHFVDADTVHPLLFWRRGRRDVYAVDPARLPLILPIPRRVPLRLAILLGRPLSATAGHGIPRPPNGNDDL